jgi:hypothetical protein
VVVGIGTSTITVPVCPAVAGTVVLEVTDPELVLVMVVVGTGTSTSTVPVSPGPADLVIVVVTEPE